MALWRVRADVLDVPGRLAALAAAVGAGGGNVLAFEVHARAAGSVTDELVVDLPVADTPALLAGRLHAAGAGAVRAIPADAHELVDMPTQLVDAVARLTVDPDALPAVLALAVRADTVELAVAPVPASPHAFGVALGGGRVAVLSRRWAPFTATEVARARAVARVAVVLSALPPVHQWLVALPDGSEVTIRTARAEDTGPVVAMYERSTLPPELAAAILSALTAQRPGASVLAAWAAPDTVVAVGLVVPAAAAPIAEVGVFVEDAAQRRGIGTALLRRLAALAREQGVRELVGVTRPSNVGARRAWRRAGLGGETCADGDLQEEILELRADLTGDPVPSPNPAGP
jgi:L-amino acid N-acyltransferase YncA